MTTTTDSKGHR